MDHAIYRHFDKDDRLLYVGRSSNPANRLNGHERSSGWFNLIFKVTLERCSSKAAAKSRERAIIRREKPIFNKILYKIKRTAQERIMAEKKQSPITADALEQFRVWGAMGGKAKAKKYTRRQIGNMVKRGKRKAKNGKCRAAA